MSDSEQGHGASETQQTAVTAEAIDKPKLEVKGSKGGAVSLALAAILSVALVYATGLLIGVMQYQSRITSTQNGLTSGQVIFFLDIEDKILKTINELTVQSKSLSDVYTKDLQTIAELGARINGMCSVLVPNAGTPESSTRQEICNQFLRQIPFNAVDKTDKLTGSEKQSAPTVNTTVNPEDKVSKSFAADRRENLSDTEIEIINQKLESLLGGGNDQAAYITKIVDMYRIDLSKVAYLNQVLSIELQPELDHESLRYNYACLYLQQLTKLLAYRPTDYRFCQMTSAEITLPIDQHSTGPVPIVLVNNTTPTGSLIRTTPEGVEVKVEDKSESAAKANESQTVGTGANRERPGGSVLSPPVNPPIPSGQPSARSEALPAFPGQNVRGSVPFPVTVSPVPVTLGVPAQTSTDDNPRSVSPSAQRDFELVAHYKFYQGITFNTLNSLIISPPEFLAFVLVCISGILGSLLRIVLYTYTTGRDPNFKDVFVGPILGMICALVVYILLRSGYIAITDRAQTGDGAVLSPFIIAFASLASGLLSERAVARFRSLSSTWFGEDAQPQRWGLRLSEVIGEEQLKKVSDQLGVSQSRLKGWISEEQPVPAEQQHDIALIFGKPIRELFSEIPPPQKTPNA